MSQYKVVNPATGETVIEYPTATDATIADALTRVHEGYQKFRLTSKSERASILHKVADLYRDRADMLGAIITREMGKTLVAAKGEIDFAINIYRYYAEHGEDLLADLPIPTSAPGTAFVRKSPIGPVLGIMPWNYPYYQVARFAAPNIMIGNTILLKHAPQCPESALAMEEIFHDAGLSPDAYINIFASNEQVADILADPRVYGVSVTGSERAGTAVAAVAGQNLKKVVLELGGSDPFIVLDTEDLPKVVIEAIGARMENGGQACSSAKRFIVADSIYNDFVDQLTAAMESLTTGDPTDPSTSYGPMSSEQAAHNLEEQVQDAVSKGATLRTGGRRVSGVGSYFEPSVLVDIKPGMRAYREELFGPVAMVYRVANADEAVELANDSPYGLGAAIYTANQELALEMANRIDTGMVWINGPEGGGADLPFGGTKRSGIGRELGPLGIDEFVNKKLINVPPSETTN